MDCGCGDRRGEDFNKNEGDGNATYKLCYQLKSVDDAKIELYICICIEAEAKTILRDYHHVNDQL